MRFTIAFAAAVICAAARAQAAAEFCPATIAHGVSAVNSRSYTLQLGAMSERSVSGRLKMETDRGWYEAPFADVALQPVSKQYSDEGATFSHSNYLSEPIVVRFPADVRVQYAYVSQASASGDTQLGWDAKGIVTCDPTGAPAQARVLAQDARVPMPANAAFLVASITEPPPPGTCATPFDLVRVVHAAQARYPAVLQSENFSTLPSGAAAAIVAVDRTGSIADVWLWETSGTPVLDQAVVDAARQSTYSPARAFCENVPGYYLFRVVFQP